MRTVRSSVKRQRILEAAASVFSRRGYSEATLNEIAQLAGTQAGSLYYHFESRDHLVIELLNYAVLRMEQDTTAALSALPPDSTAKDRLVTLIRSHVLSALKLDDFARATQKISDQVSEEIHKKVAVVPRRYARRWSEVIKNAVEEGVLRSDLDQRLFRLLVVGSVSWMPDWYKSGGALSPTQVADTVIEIFLSGAQAPAIATQAEPRKRARPMSAA